MTRVYIQTIDKQCCKTRARSNTSDLQAISASLEYLCYGSAGIINILLSFSAVIDFDVNTCTERVNVGSIRQWTTINPLSGKSNNLHFHPLENVGRGSEPHNLLIFVKIETKHLQI